MSNVRKNYIYNITYQLLIFLLPIFTAPYISRVIGAEKIGVYSYTYSIAQYFTLIALLGINNYGNRCIAQVKDNKEKLSKTFFSIYAIQFVMSLLTIVFYFGYLRLFVFENTTIALIQGLYVLSVLFDINWLFFGLEKFKTTVIRNAIVKIITFFAIFLFVKDQGDLWIYTLIMCLGFLISQIILWPFALKEVKRVNIKFTDVKKHIRPCLVLFIPVLAVSLYTIMDKIMLGKMSNMTEVGYYENAAKMVNVPFTLISSLGTVMLPRISNLISTGKDKKAKEYMFKSLKFVMFFAIPIWFGFICISKSFAPFFFGSEFSYSGTLMTYLSITIVIMSFANVIRTQYLIPNEKDKVFVVSVIIGAIVNLIFNIILIPIYNSLGAVFGTVAAELSVMLYQTIKVSHEIDLKEIYKDILMFLIKGLIMLIVISMLNLLPINKLVIMFMQVVLGAIIYMLLSMSYAIDNFNIKVLEKLKGKKDEKNS